MFSTEVFAPSVQIQHYASTVSILAVKLQVDKSTFEHPSELDVLGMDCW